VKLNPKQINSRQDGAYADGGGLYLQVKGAARDYTFRFTAPDGKRAVMKIAATSEISLSEARERALSYRLMVRDGIDPRARKRLAATGGKTVKTFIEENINNWSAGLNPEEPRVWARVLKAVPSLQNMHLHEVTTEHVLAALKPIWAVRPRKGGEVRRRLEKVFGAAKALKLRTGDNPAMWRDNLKYLLVSPRKAHNKRPHRSLPYKNMPALMAALRFDISTAARCVEFGVLTCGRSQEIRLAEWSEVDFDKATWRIPGAKMKIKKDENGNWLDHLVPLSKPAIALLQSLPRKGRYIFPSDAMDEHTHYLPGALVNAVARTSYKFTMHGMRASFRNWAGEDVAGNWQHDVIEFCLAHRIGDEAEHAYWTGDMIERRRILMEAWATYACSSRGTPPTRKQPNLKLVA